MLAVHRMAGGQVFVRIPALDQRARLVRPLLVAEAVQVVAQVLGDVRERAQARRRVAKVAPLVVAARRRDGLWRRRCPGPPK